MNKSIIWVILGGIFGVLLTLITKDPFITIILVLFIYVLFKIIRKVKKKYE